MSLNNFGAKDPSGPPAFTVIIPVYNGERYLALSLQSVFAQTLQPIEVIVIDDGSQDASAKIATEFGDRVRLVQRAKSGVSDSRNHAISLAGTEWLAFLDHDDTWEPDHLEQIALTLLRRPDADVCYTGARRLIQQRASGEFRPTPPLTFPSEDEIAKALMERCAFITSSVAIRHSAVVAVGGFDKQYTNYEDWDLWLRLLRNGARFAYSPKPTLNYRIHPISATHNPSPGLVQSHAIVRRNILPYLPWVTRELHGRRVLSRLESEASILIRERGLPGASSLMLRSIFRHPFHAPNRYKIALHMLLRGYARA